LAAYSLLTINISNKYLKIQEAAVAIILENQKIPIFQQLLDRSLQNLAR